MNFCSQCGLLQPPNVRVCPRCGVAVTPDGGSEGQNADDNTIVSALEKTELSKGAVSGSKPDPMQEPTLFVGYDSQTQRIGQGENTSTNPYVQNTPILPYIQNNSFPPSGQNVPVPPYSQNTPVLPYEQNMFAPPYGQNAPVPPYEQNMSAPPYGQNASFPGYYMQNSAPSSPSHISQSGNGLSATEGISSPGAVFPPNQAYLQSPPLPQKTKSNAFLWIMVLILFLVVVTVGATTAVFVIGPDKVVQIVKGGGVTSQPTAIPSTSQASAPTLPTPTSQVPTPTPTLASEQQAQSVITNYYSAINNKDYQTAYNLWVNYPDSYQNFANGFSNTQHDDYQFGQVVQQGDGTVQVNITLVATSTSSQQTTYQGYYIVGPQSDGSWKITKGVLRQV